MSTQATADPYWSRTASKWDAAKRQDPVLWTSGDKPEVADEYGLDERERTQFEKDGFHHAPGLFGPDETSQMLAEATRLAANADRQQDGVVVEPGSHVVRSLFRVHRTNELFRSVAQDPRLVHVARQILGGDVYVHQSRINFKPAFDGKEFFWHSDFETWHIEDGMPRMRAVSVSISLTESNEFNGPLMVIPGSHTTYIRCVGATPENHFEQSLKKQQYGVPSLDAMRKLVDDGGITAPKGLPGMALFFECNLMHGSSGNLSPYPRTNLFLVYNSVENALVDPFGNQPARPDYLAERSAEPLQC